MAWIDDNPTRASTAHELGADFINVKGVDLASRVEALLGGPLRPLVIVDHILDKTSSTNPVFQRGSTIAEAIKEKWPWCPVIGVTNIDFNNIDLRTKQTYDALLPFSNFSRHFDQMGIIARDFATTSGAVVRKPADLVALLKAPESDADRLSDALPEDLKRAPADKSVSSRMYRWVALLTSRPGFLYDDLWAATYLGLNAAGFERVRTDFARAQYKGIFQPADGLRWWVSRLEELLYKKVEPQSGELSWDVGRRLPGIRKEHFSKCYAGDNGQPPEVVAYLDASDDERQPMHMKCTVLHPRFKRELYFEDIRMMRGR